jgi:hypothetical protein
MLSNSNYFKVVESVSGWRIYHIPTEFCPSEEDARQLVEDCDAFDYIVYEEDDNSYTESIELVYKED